MEYQHKEALAWLKKCRKRVKYIANGGMAFEQHYDKHGRLKIRSRPNSYTSTLELWKELAELGYIDMDIIGSTARIQINQLGRAAFKKATDIKVED